MSYHKDKLRRRKAINAAIEAELAQHDPEKVTYELTVLRLAFAKEQLPQYQNNTLRFRPDIAASLAELTEKDIKRFEEMISAYREGRSIIDM